MSRSRNREDHEDFTREESARLAGSGITGSVSRGPAGGETDKREQQDNLPSYSAETDRKRGFQRELATEIDAAAADRPTMTEFLDRLERRGIAPLPSIQSSGRFHGISFRWRGKTVKGSDLGRAYTAKGLQQKKGLRYDAHQDRESLIRALDRSSTFALDPRACDHAGTISSHERTSRTRDRDTGLSRDQEATVMEIGKFRTVAADDIRRHRYGSDDKAFARDLRVLREGKLVERRTLTDARRGSKHTVLVLTTKGRSRARNVEYVNRHDGMPQQYYAGFV